MDEKTVAIESILVLPRNQFYWTYRINEGSEHTIKKEVVFDFLKEQITKKNYVKLSDFIARFRPFMILVKEDEIIELKKQKMDIDFYRKKIEEEIFGVLNTYHSNFKENSLEKKLKEVEKKLLKDEYTTTIV